MFNIKDVANEIGFKVNTLRYWLKKNRNDCEKNIYEFNLTDLFQTITITKKVAGKNNIFQRYYKTILLDIDEFVSEFNKYYDYVNSLKKQRQNSKFRWTMSAVDCFNNNFECSKCNNRYICMKFIDGNNEPPMKYTVKRLLAEVGKPLK